MKVILSISLLSFFLTLNVKPVCAQKYEDVRENQKEILFLEDFEDETYASKFIYEKYPATFIIDEFGSLVTGSVSNHQKLRMTSKTSSGISSDIDWEFEIKIMYTPNQMGRYAFLLHLSRRDLKKRHNHIFLKIYNKRSKVWFETPYSKKSPKEFTLKIEDIISFKKFNIFTIRKINDNYTLFINKQFIGTIPSSPLESSGIIEIELIEMDAEIDYIKVSEIVN